MAWAEDSYQVQTVASQLAAADWICSSLEDLMTCASKHAQDLCLINMLHDTLDTLFVTMPCKNRESTDKANRAKQHL